MRTALAWIVVGLSLIAPSYGASLLGGVPDADLSAGTPDGWSGLTVIEVPLSGGASVQVTDFSFYANDGRGGGTHYVTPVIVARPVGSAHGTAGIVVGIGAEVQVTSPGVNNHPFSVTSGFDTVNLTGADEFLPGFWQRADGVDNVDGGVVDFGADSGPGMFQQDLDGTTFVPMIDHLVEGGHASPEGGRDYQFNLEGDVIPEPSVAWLFGLSGLALILRRRR
jgi:hypothetical protein